MTPDTPADLADLLDAHAHELEEFTSSRPETDTPPVSASTYRKAAQTIRAMEQPAMPSRRASGDPAFRLADDARFMAGGAYPAKVSDLMGIADDIEAVLTERVRLRNALATIAEGITPPQRHGHYLAHREAVKIARAAMREEAA